MRFKVLNSNKLVRLNTSKYAIKWDGNSLSKFQWNVKQFLKKYWLGQIVLEEMRIPRTRMRADIVNLTRKIIVEISGDQHREYVPYFHGDSRVQYRNQVMRDMQKQEWAELNDFKFVEIYPDDLPLTKQFFIDKYDIYL